MSKNDYNQNSQSDNKQQDKAGSQSQNTEV